MPNVAFSNAQSSTGTCTLTVAATPGVTWNLSSLSVSQAGPASGLNAKLTIWDGAVGTGTAMFVMFLNGPGAPGTGIGSVGSIQEIPIPKTPAGVQSIQATPGNAMNVQVVGTGPNQVSINGRFSDGLPG
mgnify:CR=1 FL=1